MKVGDKVVCIDDSSTTGIKNGNIYTIKSFYTCKCNLVTMDLKEVFVSGFMGSFCLCGHRCGNANLYRSTRFRKLDESFAEDVLENIKEQIEEEQLILVL